jgi:hypothetical protein
MVNIQKVIKQIHSDGKYDAILDIAKKTLNNHNPTLEDINQLVLEDTYYLKEYKDLNRWGELSSIHIKELNIKDTDTQEIKGIKQKINKNMKFLKNREEYEVASKNSIYAAWTISIALPSIYIIDNIVRLFTNLYKDNNETSVYMSFFIVVILSIWGYIKVSLSHKQLHTKYIKLQKETRKLISFCLEQKYFTFDEIYED